MNKNSPNNSKMLACTYNVQNTLFLTKQPSLVHIVYTPKREVFAATTSSYSSKFGNNQFCTLSCSEIEFQEKKL